MPTNHNLDGRLSDWWAANSGDGVGLERTGFANRLIANGEVALFWTGTWLNEVYIGSGGALVTPTLGVSRPRGGQAPRQSFDPAPAQPAPSAPARRRGPPPR